MKSTANKTWMVNRLANLLAGIAARIDALADRIRRCEYCGRNPYTGASCVSKWPEKENER